MVNLVTNGYHGLDANGRSQFTIDGTFTNSATINVGNGGLGAESSHYCRRARPTRKHDQLQYGGCCSRVGAAGQFRC